MADKDELENKNYIETFHLIDPKKKDKRWANKLMKYFATKYQVGMISMGRYAEIKRYAAGRQDPGKYLLQFDKKATLAQGYAGIDFENIISVIPKFREIVKTPIIKKPIEKIFSAYDPMSEVNKENVMRLLKSKNQINKDLAEISKMLEMKVPLTNNIEKKILRNKEGKPVLGGEGGAPDSTYDSDEELQTLIPAYYKQDHEIAMEISCDTIFDWNNFPDVAELLIDDAMDFGVGCLNVYMNQISCIPTIEHLSVGEVIIPDSKWKDFRDNIVRGYTKRFTWDEFVSFAGNELNDFKLIQELWSCFRDQGVSSGSTHINKAYLDCTPEERNEVSCECRYWQWKSINIENFEKRKLVNGRNSFYSRPFDWVPGERSDKKRDPLCGQVVYEGFIPVGTDFVFKFGLLNNMPRDKNDPYFCGFTITPYKFIEKGITETIIPMEDRIALAAYKIQHALIKSRPDGQILNLRALQNAVDMGIAGYDDVTKLVDMLLQSGSGIMSPTDATGEYNIGNTLPIIPVKNGLSNTSIEGYYTAIANEIVLIRETTGLNEARDASNPDPKALVGIQKMQLENSLSTTDYLNRGYEKILNAITYQTSVYVQDMCRYNKSTSYKRLVQAVGKYNAQVVASMQNIDVRSFGLRIEQGMSVEEKQMLLNVVSGELSKGTLLPEDAMLVINMRNYKEAARLFTMRRRKREMELNAQKERMLFIEKQGEQQKAMAVEQMRGMVEKAITEMKMKLEQMIIAGDLKKTQMQVEGVLEGKRMTAENKTNDGEAKYVHKLKEKEFEHQLDERI